MSMPNINILRANLALRNFGITRLKLDCQETSAGNLLADSIFKLLQQKSRYPPARCIFGGSIGKATAIPDSDYDRVVFINEVDLQSNEIILQDFKTLLESSFPNIKALKTTPHSVQFALGEFEFDLLLAVNFATGLNYLSGDDLVQEQADRALQKMEASYTNDPCAIYKYSSSLVEFHDLFMKRQSGFVDVLARICKFWIKTLTLDGKISGLNTIMELVAAHFGDREEINRYFPSILQAFQEFLNQMKNIDSMAIRFPHERLYPRHMVAFVKPYLVEPFNPFNNLVKNISSENMQKLKIFATETLSRITNYIHGNAKPEYFPLELIFEPQPKNPDPFAGCYPRTARLGIISTSKKYPFEHMRKKFSPETQALLKNLKMALFTAIYALTSTDKPDVEDMDAIRLAYAQID